MGVPSMKHTMWWSCREQEPGQPPENLLTIIFFLVYQLILEGFLAYPWIICFKVAWGAYSTRHFSCTLLEWLGENLWLASYAYQNPQGMIVGKLLILYWMHSIYKIVLNMWNLMTLMGVNIASCVYVMWWFCYEGLPTVLCVWTLISNGSYGLVCLGTDLQWVVLLWKVVEPSWGGTSLEEVSRWRWALRLSIPTLRCLLSVWLAAPPWCHHTLCHGVL